MAGRPVAEVCIWSTPATRSSGRAFAGLLPRHGQLGWARVHARRPVPRVRRPRPATTAGRQICVGSNESELNIADVTDKDESDHRGAHASYPERRCTRIRGGSTRSGATSIMNDEGDEVGRQRRPDAHPRVGPDGPRRSRAGANEYFAPVPASDHNLYVVGDRDVPVELRQRAAGPRHQRPGESRERSPTSTALRTTRTGRASAPHESGAWSNFPFFSRAVLVIFTSVREGLFIMRVRPPPVS